MSHAIQLPLVDPGYRYWIETRDGNDLGRSIFDRHYSRIHYADGRKPKLYAGPGGKIVLIGSDGHSLFVWRKFKDNSGQLGVNCAVFRNEGTARSSDMIREADAIADKRWPGERHYTYVDPRKVRRKRDPGRCFLRAGWHYCGMTKGGLVILAREPVIIASQP